MTDTQNAQEHEHKWVNTRKGSQYCYGCDATKPSDTQNDTSDIEASPEAQRIIHSAYQDVQGVMAGKKGYRLRQNELALAIDDYCAQREQAAELRGGVRALRNLAEGFEGAAHPQASRLAEVIERYARQLELQATKPEKGGLER